MKERTHCISLIAFFLLIWTLFSGCSTIKIIRITPTLPPVDIYIVPSITSTNPPPPTPTFTEAPTPTPTATLLPPTSTVLPEPTATASKDEAILVYYINKDDKGPWGCNEALYYLNTGVRKTGDIATDVKYALQRILSFHGETLGNLYNPGYASALTVNSVEVDSGAVVVNLSGTYSKTKDRCDGPRFRDQLRFTIRQASGINSVQIFINGAPIGDVISRK